MPNEVGLHFFQRNSDFCAAGLGNKTVPKILEPGSVLFEVDEDCDLPPFAVRDELNSSRRPLSQGLDLLLNRRMWRAPR